MQARASIAVNAALAALLLWLYGGDISDVVEAQKSELAALTSLPSLPFALIALLGTLAGAGLTLMGALSKRERSWRGYRVMPIVAVVALFTDLFVLGAGKSPFGSNARVMASFDVFERRANELSSETAVAHDARALEAALETLGPLPWLVKGEPSSAWKLKIFEGCSGPRTETAGETAGTVLYCLDANRTEGWLTLVGLPYEQRFGRPQLVTQAGQPLVGAVHPLPGHQNEAKPRFTGEEDAGTLAPP